MKKIFHLKICGLLLVALVCACLAPSVSAEEIDPAQLLVEIDNNMWSDTKFVIGRLVIDNGRRVRSLGVETWMQGVTKSFSHYKSPARERGTKMLKLESKLWMYTPNTDRKILIAGHLLRQSMMGSDLSYEDMLEDEKLSLAYTATIEKTETIEGVQCLVLILTAKNKNKTYQTRKVWADPERKIVLREQRFAKSGKLLKRIDFKDYFATGDRLFPRRMIFRDMLKENTRTTYFFDEVKFDLKIPPKYFSQRILKR